MSQATEQQDPTIGRRIRAARVWRGIGQQQLAGIAGFSKGYVSKVERGLLGVDRLSILDAFARALQVSPSDLTGVTGPFFAHVGLDEGLALIPLRLALAATELGDEIDAPPPPWEQIAPRVARVNELRSRADHAALTPMLPSLVRDLHASVDGPHRRDALIGLTDCYLASQVAAAHLGSPDLAQVAALYLRDVTNLLDGPEWAGLATWARVQTIGGTARDRAYRVASQAAGDLDAHLDRIEVVELAGMLHLVAALASTVSGNAGQAEAHLREAQDLACRPGAGQANFAHLSFGVGNVGIWRTLLAVEAGDGGRATEIARQIDPATLPASASRRCAWHIDIGRGLAMERRDEETLRAFKVAKQLAPQRARANPWVRETVAVMLERARRESAQRVRGMAFWLGVGP